MPCPHYAPAGHVLSEAPAMQRQAPLMLSDIVDLDEAPFELAQVWGLN